MGKSMRVLLVEDSADDAELLLMELQRGDYAPTCERVQTPEELREALETGHWDLIISDYSLPSFSAPDALNILQDMDIDLPFIIISGIVGDEKAVEAMRSGAHDFINKDNYARLLPAIERELREAKLRREHKWVEEEVRAKTEAMDLLNKDLHDLTMELSHVKDSERKRFAEILHDDLGQKLVAIEMGISAHIGECDCGKKVAQKLNDINALLRGTIDSIRDMSSDLYPVNPYELELIDRKGLVEAIKWHVNNFLEPAGFTVKVDIDKTVDRFSYNFKQQIYRIFQESCQNAMKYSLSSNVEVKCRIEKDVLWFSVANDGKGFSNHLTVEKKGSGVGLRLMRERVKSLNGVLTIKSSADEGTVVSAVIPVPSKE